MKANVGSYDGAVRFVLGAFLLIAANHGHRWGFVGVAVVLSATGLCPLYRVLGIDTTACDRVTAARSAEPPSHARATFRGRIRPPSRRVQRSEPI